MGQKSAKHKPKQDLNALKKKVNQAAITKPVSIEIRGGNILEERFD